MYFTTYNFEISLAMILISISVYLINDILIFDEIKINKVIKSIISILILGFAISFYQSMISVYISLVVVSLLVYLLTENNLKKYSFFKLFKIIVKYVIFLILGLVLYFVVDKILGIFFVKGDYISNFIGWKYYPFKQVVENLIIYFKSIYIYNEVYGCFIIRLSLILSAILSIYYLFKYKKDGILISLMLIFLNIVPMIIPVGLGQCMPYRTQQAFLIIIPSIWFLLSLEIKKDKIKSILLLLVIFIGFRQSMYVNKLNYSNLLRFKHDINVANKIADVILELDLPNKNDYPVVYVGMLETPDSPNIIKQELFGYSILGWDGGNYSRIQALLTISGENNKLVEDINTYNKAKELAKDMPSWPNKDSVALKDNLIIVKLSNY